MHRHIFLRRDKDGYHSQGEVKEMGLSVLEKITSILGLDDNAVATLTLTNAEMRLIRLVLSQRLESR